jgi:serine/threonine protein kinase
MSSDPIQSSDDDGRSEPVDTSLGTSSMGANRPTDVRPAEDEDDTGKAPSFPKPVGGKIDGPRHKPIGPTVLPPLETGARIDDFEIISVLGRGAFGVVYLARQQSLDREVALKVAGNQGSEGRTMARLEHQHIVQVFSETVTDDGSQRLLCMQLVPGTSLQSLIKELRYRSGDEYTWRGANLLKVLDGMANLPAVLDPSALHDREALTKMDDIEATAWFGGRLGEALDYAHHQGVLHRDIKPANILVNQYGQPMLADFNISQLGAGEDAHGQFGGTLPYMSPEHLDAFNPSVVATQESVTEQSDIYSLGLVLHELLTGKSPFPQRKYEGNMAQRVSQMADERRDLTPTCRAGRADSHKLLEQAIGRCLAPEPDDRFANGTDLAESLDGVRQLRHVERDLPKPHAITRWALKYPRWSLVLFGLLPHLAGSVVNILYNNYQIVEKLTADEQQLFVRLVFGYNAIAYPLALAALLWILRPVWSTWRALTGTKPVDAAGVDVARRKALRLPIWAAVLAIVGWMPGGLLFPAAIDSLSGLNDRWLYAHFAASFLLSGLIALAYSYCGVHYVVLRVMYPAMWSDARHLQQRAGRELQRMPLRHRLIYLLAGAVPLVVAMILMTRIVAGDEISAMYAVVVFVLIFLGMMGYEVARTATDKLTQTLVALTGTES